MKVSERECCLKAGAIIMHLLTRESFLSKKCSFPPTRLHAQSMAKENSALWSSVPSEQGRVQEGYVRKMRQEENWSFHLQWMIHGSPYCSLDLCLQTDSPCSPVGGGRKLCTTVRMGQFDVSWTGRFRVIKKYICVWMCVRVCEGERERRGGKGKEKTGREEELGRGAGRKSAGAVFQLVLVQRPAY